MENQTDSIKGSIAKNTSYLTFASILQKIISFTYFALLARGLGPENLGKYYFAISFAAVFSVIADLGLANVLTREIAKRPGKARELLGNILAIKIPLSLAAALAVFVIARARGYEPLITGLIYISTACVILDSFTSSFWAVARGFHNLFFESISSVLFQIIVMAVGLGFLYSGFSLIFIILSLLVASVFHFIYSFLTVYFKIGIKIKILYDKKFSGEIIKIAVPFALFVIFQRIYTYLDSVLLKEFAGDQYVGYYQIPFKIIFALQFLPLAFVASLYPAMSNLWQNDRKQLSITFEKSLVYLMLISLPISAGTIALADKIILIFNKNFGEAILPLQITMLATLFVFINFPIGSLLNACDRQKKNTANMAIAMVLSAIMNLILIPRYQATGASITALATCFLMTALGIYWARKIIKFNFKKIIKTFLKILAAGVLMGFIAFYLKTYLNALIIIPLCATIYFALLFVFRTIKKDEIAHIANSFLKK